MRQVSLFKKCNIANELIFCFILKGFTVQRHQWALADIRPPRHIKTRRCRRRYRVSWISHKHNNTHTADLVISCPVALRSVKLQKLKQGVIQDLKTIQVCCSLFLSESNTTPNTKKDNNPRFHSQQNIVHIKCLNWNWNVYHVFVCQPNSPTMVMDYWTGWYDTWGELHHVLPPEGRGVSCYGLCRWTHYIGVLILNCTLSVWHINTDFQGLQYVWNDFLLAILSCF